MPYYLYHGNDLKLLKKEIERFEKYLISQNPNMEIFNTTDNISLSAILDKISSGSLFSSKQFIKIYEVEKYSWLEELLDYETDNEILLISYKESFTLKNKKKIAIHTFNLPKNYELEKLIPTAFQSQISPECVDYLSKNLSSIIDLEELKESMKENNITYLTLSDVYKIKGDTQAKIFLVIDDIINQKINSALSEIHEFLESGGYIGQLINLLTSQLDKIYQIKKLQEKKFLDKEISENLGITPFIFSKLKKTALLYSIKKLESLILSIPKMDFQIRYYDKSFSHYFLEKLILEMGEK